MISSNSTDTRYCEQERWLSTYTRDIISVTQSFVLEWFLDSSIPVTVRSKAWVWSRLIAGIAGSIRAEDMDIRLLCLLCSVLVASCLCVMGKIKKRKIKKAVYRLNISGWRMNYKRKFVLYSIK